MKMAAGPLRRVVDTACRTRSLHLTSISKGAASISTVSSRNSCIYTSRHRLQQNCTQPPNSHLHVQQRRAIHLTSRLCSQPTQPSTTKYAVSASFIAKDKRYNPSKHTFSFDPSAPIRAVRSDKQTRPASGQDSFFVSRINSSPDIALGVADGVGGWADSGVDPADFAHGFCDYMAYAAYTYSPENWSSKKARNGKGGGVEKEAISARSLMQKGYEAICRDPSVPAGGSTACVALLYSSGTLEVANLGDSGFIQLRSNAIHAYSEPQTHAFNTPYQLSVVPEKVLQQAAAFGGQQLCDFPSDANVTSHEVRHGDVLVFASDGVWDNLSRQDILKIVSRIMLSTKAWEHTDAGVTVGSALADFTSEDIEQASREDAESKLEGKKQVSLQTYLAVGITGEAKAASVNTKVDGPFAREVQRYYPSENWRGGKVDDICVVVAVVCEDGK